MPRRPRRAFPIDAGAVLVRLARARRADSRNRKGRGRNLFLAVFSLFLQVVSAISMITQEHFKLLAAYNRWANARLYAAALDLSELSYRLHTGVYFGILTGGEPPSLDLLAFQKAAQRQT